MKIEQQYQEEPEVRRGNGGKGMEKEDGARERENKRREVDTGELEEVKDEV